MAMADPGVESTLHHLGLLDARRRRLVEAQIEAEGQLFHRIGAMYQNGQITDAELLEIFNRCRAVRIDGTTSRWDAHVGIAWRRLLHGARYLPNGPEGTWVGVAPLPPDDNAPRAGIPVVYVLFGEDNEPCYVGSTADLRTRLKAHLKGEKEFVRWQAYRRDSREAAYVLEERLLAERMPRLNRKAGR